MNQNGWNRMDGDQKQTKPNTSGGRMSYFTQPGVPRQPPQAQFQPDPPQGHSAPAKPPASNDAIPVPEYDLPLVERVENLYGQAAVPAAAGAEAAQRQSPPRPNAGGKPYTGDPFGDSMKTKHSQTVGPEGPVVMQDTVLHETLGDFVTSTTLPRIVHTKGFSAFGYFETQTTMSRYTKAELFQQPGTRTPVAVRFSLAVSNFGTPDTSRNVRGFSTKFYTKNGIYDLLCNHIPVFLVRDGIRFPESIKSFLASPKNNLPAPQRFWSFIARTPEATNFLVRLYSDYGTIKSLRHIRASSVNTYIWLNAAGERHYIKYHWIPAAGVQTIDRFEATKLAGENPDVAGQDLYDTIASGKSVEYELKVQIMRPEEAQNLPYDPLDDTKVWNETQFPLQNIGKLVLDTNPDNYQEQTEKIAYSPANLLEGIEFSNDKMLQGRTFIYYDAQRHRLGRDFRKIKINAQEDWVPDDEKSSGIGVFTEGTQQRSEIPKTDDFAQAGEYYDSLDSEQQRHLVDNIAADLAGMPGDIQRTVMGYLTNASQELANRITAQMKQYNK